MRIFPSVARFDLGFRLVSQTGDRLRRTEFRIGVRALSIAPRRTHRQF
jgi:hypothetical protein